MQLVIVESPNKKKTIQKYLGPGWRVEASMGHICDLPAKAMGVEAPDFSPKYELSERGKRTVNELKKISDQAESVWLATDPDREGEAIAAHLARYLKPKSLKRIQFNEITEAAVKHAITNPRDISQLLFDAQQARRVIDRLVGYQVSGSLSRVLDQRLSAGRVQTVAVRLLVERERAIRQFKGVKHFGVRLHFEGAQNWFANWDTSSFVTEEMPYVFDKVLVDKIAAVPLVRVHKIEHKEIKRYAPPPFITTTLQKAASLTLGLTAQQTMSVAQELFEKGFITYHRTDNPNFSKEAIRSARAVLKEMGHAAHIPSKPNEWKVGKNAQEAHEAIRPTDFTKEYIDSHDEKAKDLYRLIRLRALACQMSAAIIKMSTITLQAEEAVEGVDKLPIYHCRGQAMLYPGWRHLISNDQAEEKIEEETSVLPHVIKGDILKPFKGEVLNLQTKSPKRYTEPALISKLEKEGIGRPSTYAAILANIQQRAYVVVKGRFYYAEPVAEMIVDALIEKFKFLEVDYTCQLEESLDEIAIGNQTYLKVVTEVDNELKVGLAALQSVSNVSVPCPSCKAAMRRIKGKFGYFLGCSRYQEGCRKTLPDPK
jgi:DNA topoisomerase-1